MNAKVNGVALAAVTTGSIFAWSGVKGWSVLTTLADIVSGQQPRGSDMYPLVAGSASDSTLGPLGGTHSEIANIALQYKGHIYKFGGAPGRNGANPWDCSSFANWVVGHRARHAIPGYGPGKYDGSTHGPPTGSWGIWTGLRRISRTDIQAGDIIVWTLHMGIAINNKQMISATGPDGTPSTVIGDIDKGGNGFLMKYGRLVF